MWITAANRRGATPPFILTYLSTVLKLSAVDITPRDHLIQITGPNGAGKSSILDCIEMALCGEASVPSRPIRITADKGSIVIGIGEAGGIKYTVTRTFTADHTYLKVEAADGSKVPSPQTFLDTIVGSISFDPLDFIDRHSAQEQREILLKLVGVDVEPFNQKEKELRKEREEVGREQKKAQAAYEVQEYFEDVTQTEEVSISDLTEQLTIAMEHNRERELIEIKMEEIKKNGIENQAKIVTIEEKIEVLMEEKRVLQTAVNNAKLSYANLKGELAGFVSMDVDGIKYQIKNIEKTNFKIRANNAKVAKYDEAVNLLERYAALTEEISDIEAERKTLLAAAPMPVPGLSISDDNILYNGIPLAQASDGEKLMVSMGISMALNPTLRVLRIKDGSLLDSTNLQILRGMVKDQDYQLWFEKVGEDSDVGIVIEEGEIVKVDGEKPEAPEPIEPKKRGRRKKDEGEAGKEKGEGETRGIVRITGDGKLTTIPNEPSETVSALPEEVWGEFEVVEGGVGTEQTQEPTQEPAQEPTQEAPQATASNDTEDDW